MAKLNPKSDTIVVIRKDSLALTVTIENYQLKAGDKLYFTIADRVENPNFTYQAEITTFTAEGKAEIFIDSSDLDIDAGNYLYDVQVNLENGVTETLIGPALFIVKGGVTY